MSEPGTLRRLRFLEASVNSLSVKSPNMLHKPGVGSFIVPILP